MALIEIGLSYDEAIAEEIRDSEPLPEGNYDVTIKDVILDKGGDLFISERTGTHNFKVTFIIAAPGMPQDGKKIQHTITIDGNARPMFVRFCKHFNISWTDSSLDLEKLRGLNGQAHIVQDEYNGRTNNKIKYFL